LYQTWKTYLVVALIVGLLLGASIGWLGKPAEIVEVPVEKTVLVTEIPPGMVTKEEYDALKAENEELKELLKVLMPPGAIGRVTVQTRNILFSSLIYPDPATEGFSFLGGEITPYGEFLRRNFVSWGEFEKLPDVIPTEEPYDFNLRIFEKNFVARMAADPVNPRSALVLFEDTTTGGLTLITITGYRGFPWIPVALAIFIIMCGGGVYFAMEKCVPASLTFEYIDPRTGQKVSIGWNIHQEE